MYLHMANAVLEIEQFYLKSQQAYCDFFFSNESTEQKLSKAQQSAYIKHKKIYGIARQNFIADKTESTAKAFVEALDAYSAFKAQIGFTYLSINDYYEKTVVQAQHKNNNNLNFIS